MIRYHTILYDVLKKSWNIMRHHTLSYHVLALLCHLTIYAIMLAFDILLCVIPEINPKP